MRNAKEPEAGTNRLPNESSFPLLEKMVAASLDIICTIDSEGCFVWVNEATLSIWGYLPQELTGKPYIDFVVPEDQEVTLQTAAAIVGGTKFHSFVNRYQHKDGRIITMEWSATWAEAERLMFCVARDISDKSAAEAKLVLQEKRFRALVQSGSDLIAIIGLDGVYSYVSETSLPVLGYHPADLIGRNAFDFIHTDDISAVGEQLASIAGQRYLEAKPFRFRNAAGEWRWIESKVTNLLGEPAVAGIVVNSRDITDTKSTNDRFASLSRVAEQTDNIVIIADKEGQITWVNEAFERLSGYSMEEAIGKKPGMLLQGPATDVEAVAYMSSQLRNFQPFDVEIINYNRLGEPYEVQIHCQPQFNEQGLLIGHFAIQTDITEKRRLERQLQEEVEQRQKSITSAIVKAQELERAELSKELHDNVNQILTTVKLHLDMIKSGSYNSSVLVDKAMRYVQTSIDEIRQISKRLAASQWIGSQLGSSIRELIESFSITGRIHFQFTEAGLEEAAPAEDISLAVYRIMQEQFTNIIKYSGASTVNVSISIRNNNLRLAIVDDGVGFDTAKHRHGIGISNMHHRVETLNGRIEIKSKPGQGCTLLAVIPLTLADRSAV
jgi:PAS domain S-box-containing protein